MDVRSVIMIRAKDKRYFNKAAQLAELSTYHKVKVGCVIVYHNHIISTGFNKERTDPLQMKYNIYHNIPKDCLHKLHAEMDAIKHIIDLNINWKNVSIYVYRKRNDKLFGMGRPCKACMNLIKELGIRHVFYTTDNGYCYEKLE